MWRLRYAKAACQKLQTFVLVMKSMTAKGKFAEIIHFSAQSLVVFFFRLPLVGGQIVDALISKKNKKKIILDIYNIV